MLGYSSRQQPRFQKHRLRTGKGSELSCHVRNPPTKIRRTCKTKKIKTLLQHINASPRYTHKIYKNKTERPNQASTGLQNAPSNRIRHPG